MKDWQLFYILTPLHRLFAIHVLAAGSNERNNAAERRSGFPPSGGDILTPGQNGEVQIAKATKIQLKVKTSKVVNLDQKLLI